MTAGTIEKEIAYVKRMLSIAGDDHEKRCFWQGKLTILQRWLAYSKAQDGKIAELEDKNKYQFETLVNDKIRLEKEIEKLVETVSDSLTPDEARGIINKIDKSRKGVKL